MKIRIFATVFFVLLLPALACAAITGVAKTGQSVCYNASGTEITCAGTGQDGDIQIGSAWPNPRFTPNDDETVTDNMTGLVWSKDANPVTPAGEKTWQEALDYIKTLNSGNYLNHNDWRLPNRNELASLVDSSQIWPALPSGHPFVNLQTGYVYWSSSTVINFKYAAWAVNMNLGGVDEYGKTSVGHLWPVRGGQSGRSGSLILYKTGQTLCYNDTGDAIACANTGQDGEIHAGAAWPSSRFTANNAKQTVADNITGLVWSKDANPAGATKTWQEALDYVKTINISNYLGYNDWRLPNRNEQAGLIDSSQFNPALTSVNPFINVQADAVYWSSSAYLDSPGLAWVVDMDAGIVSYNGKTESGPVWPVRGGQSLVVSKTGSGAGAVTSSPPWINCGATCSESFTTGSTVTLTATPASGSGSIFVGWSGSGCTGTGACIVTMDASKSVSALFNATLAANAGYNQIVFNKAILDGSASQGNILSWNWTLTHQTNPAYSRTATGQKPSLDNLAAGFYDVLLTVSDGTATSTATSMLAVAGPCDVNGDGKAGLAEVIYILQTMVGMR